MSIAEIEQAARVAAIGAGIIFGAAAISAASWVWLKRQIFAYGGSALSLAGIVLMGLSIYKTVDVKAAPDGIQLKLAELGEQLAERNRMAAALEQKTASLETLIKGQLPSEGTLASNLRMIYPLIDRRISTLEQTLNTRMEQLVKASPVTPPRTSSQFISVASPVVESEVSKSVQDIRDVDAQKKAVEELARIVGLRKSMELSRLYLALGDRMRGLGRPEEADDAFKKAIQYR